MVGRVIACILLVLLAALVIALTIPARVRFSYDQGALALWVRYGPVRLQLFPPKEKPPRKKRRTKEEPAAQEPPQSDSSPSERLKEKRKKKSPKSPKPRPGINLDQILYSLETLPPVLVRLLGRTGRGVRVEPLKLHLLIACADPADTAILYGRIQAALSAGLPLLQRAVRIKDQDIRLFPDFLGDRMDCIADVGVSLRPGVLAWAGLRAGGSALKWFLGFRRLASPPPAKEQTAPKGQAADSEAA